MRFLSATFSIVFLTVTLQAQAAPAVPPLVGQACPVSLGVSRWSTLERRNALAEALRPGQDPHTPIHGLYLRASRTELLPAITQVTAIAYGDGFRPHAQNVSGAPAAGTSDRTQTFQLASNLRDSSGFWKLTVDQFPLVREVDLTVIRFADGSTWHESPGSQCRVQPDGLLLVAGTQ